MGRKKEETFRVVLKNSKKPFKTLQEAALWMYNIVKDHPEYSGRLEITKTVVM